MVARAAMHLITPSTHQYLREHLLYVWGKPDESFDSELEYASIWADLVVRDGSRPETGPYHFVNMDDIGGRRECAPLRDACPSSEVCIVGALSAFTERASDIWLPVQERTEALMYVIHLVADAHNPVHTGFASDRGGTQINLNVSDSDSVINLHWLWDDLLVERVKGSRSWWEVADTDLVTEDIPSSKLGGFDIGNITSMVSSLIVESTCTWAYQKDGPPRDWLKTADLLTEEYIASRSEIARKLLRASAARLAQFLDRIALVYYTNVWAFYLAATSQQSNYSF